MIPAQELIAFVFTIPVFADMSFFQANKQQANFLNKPRLAVTLVIFVHFDKPCCPKQYTQDTLSCPTTNEEVVDSSRIRFSAVFTVTDKQRSLAWRFGLK